MVEVEFASLNLSHQEEAEFCHNYLAVIRSWVSVVAVSAL